MREFSLPARYEVSGGEHLPGLLRSTAERHPGVGLIARREGAGWRDMTAPAFVAEVRAVAKGLLASGVRPGQRVGLMSPTRYEWTLFDFAIWTAGAVTVPVYETSSPAQIAWNLRDSGAVAAVVCDAERRAALASVGHDLPELTRIWTMDPGKGEESGGENGEGNDAPGAVAALTAAGAGVSDAELDAATATLTAESPATVIYTSGTTGRPKGCVLSHRAFLAMGHAVVASSAPLFRTGDSSVLLFLPLAHVFARMVEVVALCAPIRLGHVPDAHTLTDDLATFRPTIVLGVPRVFEKLFNGARAAARERRMGWLFDRAAAVAIAYSRALDRRSGPGVPLRLAHRLGDRLVYRRIRDTLGGRATHAISGGGPLGERLGHFFRGIGFTVLEGYGLTETCAPTAFNPCDAPRIGTVGLPLAGSAVRVADDGEVLVRGDHLFTGYLGDERATREAMAGGWFHTGDLGSLDTDGYLTITGRKKEILVTAGGKNVAPAVIEDRVRAHELIAECMVVGDGRPFVAALITLDDAFLRRWAGRNGLGGVPRDELPRHPLLLAAVQKAVDDGNAAVSRAESVRKFRVLPGQFTQESGHLTPSLKLRRHVVAKDFAGEIDALYR
ncbi:AMP-dependent synthetase/ligase [Streptomyces radicis]|uniref:Acyl-CoA synthetase n=1 Tax=Streptomyces radicis TaxID=1750517 RepID=A0A3A9VZP7_9ACTN|nr:AMP-dependent synthetase/ligase [Streptomyces radicis]RKN06170.1 long-chain fatty acid--CoA ligase [Streptomyces radicis]RKN18539.1 long-chain fatty acid--CoA ligase [Streptomyces radicis]